MAYSSRKAIMICELTKMFGIEDTALNLNISVESVKRAIRYARKVVCSTSHERTKNSASL